MNTHFLTVEIGLPASPAELQAAIATELQRWGEPLRWAITAIDVDQRKVQIEAVVITPTQVLIPDTLITTI